MEQDDQATHDEIPAVVVDQLSKTYLTGRIEVHALTRASLTVQRGELVAVMGPSGSGKSTLLHLIAGLDVPTGGSIHVGGHCVSLMPDDEATAFRRRHVGFVYQSFDLLPDLTIEENVGVPLMLDGRSQGEIDGRVTELLVQVRLDHRRRHYPSEVSGGEQQRAAIARALIAAPAVLLADEPTGNLDSASGARVLDDIRHAVAGTARAAILVTHDPHAAASADRVEHLVDGTFRRS